MANLPTTPTPTPEVHYIPDRKVWAGGLSAVVSWLIMKGILLVLEKNNINLPLDPATLSQIVDWLSGAVFAAAAYYVPPTLQDILRRLNADVINAAKTDPGVPLSAKAMIKPRLASDPQ